jgi:hypothetical protein
VLLLLEAGSFGREEFGNPEKKGNVCVRNLY